MPDAEHQRRLVFDKDAADVERESTLDAGTIDSGPVIPDASTPDAVPADAGFAPDSSTAPRVTSVSITPTHVTLELGGEQQLTAIGYYSNGTTSDLTTSAIWASSNTAVLTLSSSGLARAIGSGTADITATMGAVSDSLTVATRCTYPAGNSSIQYGGTMPALSWPGAYRGDGTQTSFDLNNLYCQSASIGQPSVLIFVIGTGWCSACTSYIPRVNDQSQSIKAAGGTIIYAEVETANYGAASNRYANSYINNLIGNGPGIRVGDADTRPNAGALNNGPIVTQYPTAFVVRMRDMKIITDQTRSNSMLPYASIARNPEADWSNPDAPPFVNNCGPNDEEFYEPNDTVTQAALIAPGSFDGGICTAARDFYRIDLTSWRLTLEFSHNLGDIDVYVWNESTDSPLMQSGQKVGSDSATDDERFEHSGPAVVSVHGYNSASAPYRLTLEQR